MNIARLLLPILAAPLGGVECTPNNLESITLNDGRKFTAWYDDDRHVIILQNMNNAELSVAPEKIATRVRLAPDQMEKSSAELMRDLDLAHEKNVAKAKADADAKAQRELLIRDKAKADAQRELEKQRLAKEAVEENKRMAKEATETSGYTPEQLAEAAKKRTVDNALFEKEMAEKQSDDAQKAKFEATTAELLKATDAKVPTLVDAFPGDLQNLTWSGDGVYLKKFRSLPDSFFEVASGRELHFSRIFSYEAVGGVLRYDAYCDFDIRSLPLPIRYTCFIFKSGESEVSLELVRWAFETPDIKHWSMYSSPFPFGGKPRP